MEWHRLPLKARPSCTISNRPWRSKILTEAEFRGTRLLKSGSSVLRGVRVCFFVRFPKPTCADVGVDLRCRQAFMAQQFLDTSEVGTAIQQVSRKTVTQSVRSSLLRQSGGLDMGFEHSPDAASRQATSEAIEKYGRSLFLRSFRIGLTHGHPMIQSLRRVAADRSQTFFAALAHNSQNTG